MARGSHLCTHISVSRQAYLLVVGLPGRVRDTTVWAVVAIFAHTSLKPGASKTTNIKNIDKHSRRIHTVLCKICRFLLNLPPSIGNPNRQIIVRGIFCTSTFLHFVSSWNFNIKLYRVSLPWVILCSMYTGNNFYF